eukprot:6211963-Pleurochrysis_carterae.AAC.2
MALRKLIYRTLLALAPSDRLVGCSIRSAALVPAHQCNGVEARRARHKKEAVLNAAEQTEALAAEAAVEKNTDRRSKSRRERRGRAGARERKVSERGEEQASFVKSKQARKAETSGTEQDRIDKK